MKKLNFKTEEEYIKLRLEELAREILSRENQLEISNPGEKVLEEVEVAIIQGSEGLEICLDEAGASISYGRPVELFRGLGFLVEWIREGRQQESRKESPCFEHLTYMADCSRNAVPKVEYVKGLVRKLALMGYDRLMLYTEDTYEVEGYAYFGYMRGRYAQAEIRELDAYAAGYGIELVPCIQTLAHLENLFLWRQYDYLRDTGDILLCGQEETYDLIEAMVKTWSENCKSRLMNIGMDEAEMIGRGKYVAKFGYEERFNIMEKHLKRVLEICRKYGYTCMMWSDMFFKTLGQDSYHNEDFAVPEEVKERIPKEVELIYWDYYSRETVKYETMIEQHKLLTERVAFAGGAWKWNGFAPLLRHSIQCLHHALPACEKHGIQNMLVTGWGDNGAEASQAVVLPVLSYYAEYSYAGNLEEEWVAKRFQTCTGGILEDFLEMDSLNLTPDNPSPGRVSVGPGKYLLYQDILLGLYDRHIDPDTYPPHFEACAVKLSGLEEKGGEYGYVFAALAALARVLSLKSDLGIRLKKAYEEQDRESLAALKDQSKRLLLHMEDFHEKVKYQWRMENKAFGLEVLDIRLGGLKERIKAVEEQLDAYLEGRIERIEELEEERLPLDIRENWAYRTLPLWDNIWEKIVSASGV